MRVVPPLDQPDPGKSVRNWSESGVADMALPETLWEYVRFVIGEQPLVAFVMGMDLAICVVFSR